MTLQPPINNAPAWDWWVHNTGATASYPAGGGQSSPTAAQTGPGKKVILHAIIPLTGFTGPISLLDGAGASYLGAATFPAPGNVNGQQTPYDLFLENGLGISGGAAGAWLISYSVIY